MSVNIFKNGVLTKLAGKFLIDLQMSNTSTNAVANSVAKQYVDNKIGNTDISTIGDGTCTGAISTLKSDLDNAKLLHTITPTSGETWSSVITRIANYLHDNFVEADMPKLVINRDNSFYKVSVFKSNVMTFGNVAGYGEGVSITGASSDYTGGALNTVIISSTGNISVYSNSNTPYAGGDIKIYRV